MHYFIDYHLFNAESDWGRPNFWSSEMSLFVSRLTGWVNSVSDGLVSFMVGGDVGSWLTDSFKENRQLHILGVCLSI